MPLSTLRILLVDDYEPMRELKKILLRRMGPVVIEAQSGREALKILETEPLDLAILDINLPDMSAIELSEAIQPSGGTAPLPVIYTSASERPHHLDPGAVFFQEPLDKTELATAILKLVGR
jgi:CheY-like chemotaxis protein